MRQVPQRVDQVSQVSPAKKKPLTELEKAREKVEQTLAKEENEKRDKVQKGNAQEEDNSVNPTGTPL